MSARCRLRSANRRRPRRNRRERARGAAALPGLRSEARATREGGASRRPAGERTMPGRARGPVARLARGRLRAWLLAADGQLDPLRVEAHEAGDPLGPGYRLLVAPDDVVVGLAADLRRPVRRVALVRTVRRRVGGPEELGAHVLPGQVVPGRQPGLVQQD